MIYVQLANGCLMPQVGLGTFDLKKDSIRNGLEAGYRLLDTAWQYGNEEEVGQAVHESGINRNEIFITTKLWTEQIRTNKVREALENSLRNLKEDYVDLYLIHWPANGYEKAWETMIKLMQEEKVKNIGVSNFNPQHLDAIKHVGVVPVINQIESHPYFRNDEMIEECAKRNISVQAWCPLGGSYSNLKSNSLFDELSHKYEKTPAQIILRWHIQRNVMIIPRSSQSKRLRENMQIFDFVLDEADMKRVNALDTGKRMGADPDCVDF